jgi:hypothetical protein
MTISTISSNNDFLTVRNDSTYITSGGTHSGAVHYNTTINRLEVYNGYNWQSIENATEINLSPYVIEILTWAREKMEREKKINEYAQKYPAVKSIKEEMDLTQDKMDVILALVS